MPATWLSILNPSAALKAKKRRLGAWARKLHRWCDDDSPCQRQSTETAKTPDFGEGSRGEAVVALRYLLTARGFNPDGIDGIYGPLTLAAAHSFQARYDLAGANGEIDAAAWNALIRYGR
jgi:peptidoglycan hydrolase-like protein with peptidoglycan-binding domain